MLENIEVTSLVLNGRLLFNYVRISYFSHYVWLVYVILLLLNQSQKVFTFVFLGLQGLIEGVRTNTGLFRNFTPCEGRPLVQRLEQLLALQ